MQRSTEDALSELKNLIEISSCRDVHEVSLL